MTFVPPDGAPLGLVLTGGGARGAYQAGALVAIAEITGAAELPFQVLSGSSAGSINVAHLAARVDDFAGAARALANLWCGLQPRDVFRTDGPTLLRTTGKWLTDLGFGGWLGTGRGKALLDTAPLHELLRSTLDPRAIADHVAAGKVSGVAVTATDYQSGLGVTFFDGAESIAPWNRVTRIAVRKHIAVEHVLASTAIPLFFPAVEIEGDWYADGCIRMGTPLSPAIRMGARRVLAIAVNHAAANAPAPATHAQHHPYPRMATTAGLLLDALFLDALEADVERARRINHTLSLLSPEVVAAHATPLVPIEVLVLRPSIDPASLVVESLDRFPATVRHLFRGLGASDAAGWNLLSYLAFEGVYATRLAKLGYTDTVARTAEVEAFCDPHARAEVTA